MLKLLTYVFCGLFTTTVTLGTLTLLYRDPPVSISDAHFVTPVYPGHSVTLEYDVDRYRICDAHVDHTITDAAGTTFILPSYDVPSDAAVFEEPRHRVVLIPDNISVGPAVYQASRSYVCSMSQNLWPIVVPSEAVNFIVSAPKPPPKPEVKTVVVERTIVKHRVSHGTCGLLCHIFGR